MGETVKFGSGSDLRVVAQESDARRYFFTCRRCKTVTTVDYTRYQTVVPGQPQSRRESWGMVHAGWWYGLGTYPGFIPNYQDRCTCGGQIEGQELRAVVSERHVCDARCVNAKRADCECACGGLNHGAAHRIA